MPRPHSPKASAASAKKTLSDARSLAQSCLESVLLRRAPLQQALDAAIRSAAPSTRDAGLATELSYGYLRLKARHDSTLARHLSKPGKLPPALSILLGQCTHALVELDRVPAYATVDWGVQTAKNRFGPGLGKLANAVLRRVADLGEAPREADFHRTKGDSEERFLARFYSCPEWIVSLWRTSYGNETALQYLQAQAAAPPVGVRLNPAHPRFAELTAVLQKSESVRLACPPGYALADSSVLPDLAALEQQGALSRQSLASLQTLQELGLHEWEAPLWDACCGHGGKSCAVLESRGQGFALWASDSDQKRLTGLGRELTRLKLPDVPVFRADASRPPLGLAPKTILIDAPCSGLGVLSRRPDAKWRRTARDSAQLAALQQRILDAAVPLLPKEGRLIYVTCTLHPSENERQVARLLERYPSLNKEHEWRTPADSALREFFYGVALRC